MIELRIAASEMKSLRSHLLGSPNEQCAVLFAAEGRGNERQLLVAREVMLASQEDYDRCGVNHAVLKPTFVAAVTKRARLASLSLVFVHTHPGDQSPQFSQVDDIGEAELAAFLTRRGQTSLHAAMVLSQGGMRARVLGQTEEVRVVSVGEHLRVEFNPRTTKAPIDHQFDRQVRAFGVEGQRTLQSLCVAIVGLGGTGSIAAEQLTRLGVRDFILIDPDRVEGSNLNRVVAAYPGDIGSKKVEVAQRSIERIAPQARVRAIAGDVVHTSVARHLIEADLVLCCTDSHGSRSVIQQVAYQYFLPCIDIGSSIVAKDGVVSDIFGRVQLLGPDQPCLWCTGLLSSEQVRQDLANEFERQSDPYIQGAHEPAPAVISLNGTVVSLAVTMMLGVATAVPIEARHLIYNAKASTVRPVRGTAASNCFICSRAGVRGRGDTQSLFARQD